MYSQVLPEDIFLWDWPQVALNINSMPAAFSPCLLYYYVCANDPLLGKYRDKQLLDKHPEIDPINFDRPPSPLSLSVEKKVTRTTGVSLFQFLGWLFLGSCGCARAHFVSKTRPINALARALMPIHPSSLRS